MLGRKRRERLEGCIVLGRLFNGSLSSRSNACLIAYMKRMKVFSVPSCVGIFVDETILFLS
jgi:hypothetical protein